MPTGNGRLKNNPRKEGGPDKMSGEYEKENICKKAFALFALYYTVNM